MGDIAPSPRRGYPRKRRRAHLVRIGVVVGHVGRALLFDQHPPPTGEEFHHPSDDLVQHRLQRFIGWRGDFDEFRSAVNATPAHAVQHQAVQVNVEIGRRAEALEERDSAAVGFVCLQPGLPEQLARDHAVHDLQHRRHQLGLCGQQQAPRDRQRQHPLAHRHMGDDVVHQVSGGLCHASGTARGAKAAPIAVEGDQLVVAAVSASAKKLAACCCTRRYSVVCPGR